MSPVVGATRAPPTQPPCTLGIYNCLVDPCSSATCPAQPTATCRANTCGGCNAHFFDDMCRNVTLFCNTPATTTAPTCTLGIYNCLVDPCSSATCPAQPTATCIANYCGGCNAHFFDDMCRNVTLLCNTPVTTTAPTTGPQLICPPPGFGGVCSESCQDDASCPSGYLCCSNGCGRSCMRGIALATTSGNCFSIKIMVVVHS